jgi:hypothetical protein
MEASVVVVVDEVSVGVAGSVLVVVIIVVVIVVSGDKVVVTVDEAGDDGITEEEGVNEELGSAVLKAMLELRFAEALKFARAVTGPGPPRPPILAGTLSCAYANTPWKEPSSPIVIEAFCCMLT